SHEPPLPHTSSLSLHDALPICTSNGQDWTHSNIPSPNSPSFIALNAKTGEFLAEDDAHIGPHIFHGQWSSPSLAVVNGRKLVLRSEERRVGKEGTSQRLTCESR